jgi:CHASE2 domain-containing sensor protein
MKTLRDFHATWAYVAIAANGLVGAAALVAWKRPRLRGKWLWIATIAAESALLVQVVCGVILQTSKQYVAPGVHMFYGFLVFITIGLAYQYRFQMRGRREMLYGLTGLFLMGLGIRAVLQVA